MQPRIGQHPKSSKKRFCFLWAVVISLTIANLQMAHSGVLSGLAKLVKKVDPPTTTISKVGDDQLKNLGLVSPDGSIPTPLTLKVDESKQWVLRNSDDSLVDLNKVDELGDTVIVIDKVHLPKDLDKLSSLPESSKLVVRHGSSLFQVSKTQGWSVKAKNFAIPISDGDELLKAINYLAKPWPKGPVRILGLKDKQSHSLSIRRGVDFDTLLERPSQLRGQTVVLSGPIKDGSISVARKNLPLAEIRQSAYTNDIQLIILESQSAVSPKALSQKLGNMKSDVSQDTGDLLSRLHEKNSIANYSLDQLSSGEALISRVAPKTIDTTAGQDLLPHVFTRILLYRPVDEKRESASQLKDQTQPENNGFIVYLVCSVVLGLMVPNTNAKLYERIWPELKSNNKFLLTLYRISTIAVSLVILLPLFGLPIALVKGAMVLFEVLWSIPWLIFLGLKGLIDYFREKLR